jgi:hypothetical protein
MVVVAAIAFAAVQFGGPPKAHATPILVTPPAITGNLEVGSTINLSSGTWTTTWTSGIAFGQTLWSCSTASASSCDSQPFGCREGWNVCQNSTFDLIDSLDGRYLRLRVTACDTGCTESFSTIVGPVTQPRSLLVRTEGTGSVTASGATIGCPSVCAATVRNGTLVTLTATSASGWAVSSWGGSCSGSQTTCSILMNQSREVSVTFVEAPTGSGTGGSGFTSSTIDVTTPTGVRWSVQDLWIVAEFASSAAASYAITATNGSTTSTGTCSQSGSWVICRARVTPGSWVGTISPAGTPTTSLTTRKLSATRVESISKLSWSNPTPDAPLIAKFKTAEATTYTIKATLKDKTVTGSCSVSGGQASCSIKLKTKGAWSVVITPKKKGSSGKPARKILKI